jgi:predicted nucleic acid-binding protein
MKLFLDTSSLVKLYHREAGTDELAAVVDPDDCIIYLSALTVLEFRSAVWKKVRTGELSRDAALAVIGCFTDDYESYHWINIDQQVVSLARDALMKYGEKGLRTLDSIQLASALSVKEEGCVYASADELLVSFYRAENLMVVPCVSEGMGN